MLSRLYRYYWIGRALGWDNLPRRVWQETKLRLGVLRRRLPGGPAPAETLRAAFVSDYAPERSTHFWSQRAEQLGLGTQRVAALRTALRGCVDDATWDRTVGAEVRDLAAGRFRMFSRQVVELGRPPKFNFDGFHGVEWPTGLHWTEYSPAKLKLPELKLVWEASRFSWAYALARHHVRTGAAEPAQLFWEYLRSWDAQNPYGLTTQWSCGQESSFRCFAWVFAACATMGAGGAAAADLHRLTELVWYTGRHVRENINYARSQKNNHAISEAVCLLMIGRLFPELSAARGWERAGAKILAEEVERQVYADGSFVQHSTNYHRVMLDDLSWAASVMRATGGTLPERVQRKFRLAAEWLAAFTDRETGDVPNYGPNDGALILPLSCCDYRDYRPAVQAASVLAGDGRVFDGGPWDEALMWLGGREEAALRGRGGATTLPRAPSEFPEGGYYCFRGPASFGFVRCHTYRDRPTQADMLHFDLTYRGVNVLRDAGSYAYNTKPPWQQWFPGTAAHNTITVDDQDQMEKGPRFLWLRWTRAGVRAWERASDGSAELFRGEHYGYRRLQAPATHERRIGRIGDTYVIVDEVTGAGGPARRVALRWRLCPGEWRSVAAPPGMSAAWERELDGKSFRIAIAAPAGADIRVLEGQEAPPEGWESRYYNERTPAPTIVVRSERELPCSFVTICGPAEEDWAHALARLDSDPMLPPLRAAATLRGLMEGGDGDRLVRG